MSVARSYRRKIRQPSHQSSIDSYASIINEKIYMVQFNTRAHRKTIFSYSNPSFSEESQTPISKWALVRQRLPEILALNPTYKPRSVRAQLMLLVALMNQQTDQLRRADCEQVFVGATSLPRTVMINIDGRQRFISLKQIPADQVIHVDIEGVTLSIPTRQLIIAISRGDILDTAVKYCPPAIRELLIELSKTKIIHDGQRYKRALYKTRIGQSLYVGLLILLIGMVFALIISASNTFWNLNASNRSSISSSMIDSANLVVPQQSLPSFDPDR